MAIKNKFENIVAMKLGMEIDQIQNIRAMNNKNWMDLMRLAFKHAPDEAKEILKKISECDSEITKLTIEMSKE